jgi:hypothetical protein
MGRTSLLNVGAAGAAADTERVDIGAVAVIAIRRRKNAGTINLRIAHPFEISVELPFHAAWRRWFLISQFCGQTSCGGHHNPRDLRNALLPEAEDRRRHADRGNRVAAMIEHGSAHAAQTVFELFVVDCEAGITNADKAHL